MTFLIKRLWVWVPAGMGLMLGALSAGGDDPLGARQPRQVGPVATSGALGALARVPFIQNQGQVADQQVLFYARTFGGAVYVTAEGALVYALPRGAADSQQPTAVPQMVLLRETLVDADLVAPPAGAERSGTIINSFIGDDPCRWQANIPSFNAVEFGEIYEGVTLEVRAAGNNVEKIFTVAPGADPGRIILALEGADGVSITAAGELQAETISGPVRFSAPVAYQVSAAGERQNVNVAYALEGDQIGFGVGAFDERRPLVIDPLLAASFIGGSSNNVIRAIALDSQTNVFVAGYTASANFPTATPYDSSYNGGLYDVVLAKFDPKLTNLYAATYLGGSGADFGMALAVNTNNGRVYVAGYTDSTNFPRYAAIHNNYGGGAYEAFVTRLNNNLSVLQVSTYLGGANVDQAYALALDSEGEVFVAGLTSSTNFPTTNNAFGMSYQTQTNRPGSNDAFIVRFNANLSANLAATYLGGTNDDGAYAMALVDNSVYVAGWTTSTNFPVPNGADQTHNYLRDAFVARLTNTLTGLTAATFLGGTNNEEALAISVASFTNMVCVAGWTSSTNFPRNPTNNVFAPGYTNTFMGGRDAFLTRLSVGLNGILASTYLGGATNDEATAVLIASVTNDVRVYVAGWTDSGNFPVTTNAYDTAANGGRDAFVCYWSTPSNLQASTYLGGGTDETAYALAFQASTNAPVLFVAGATASSNFPATLRAYDYSRTGSQTNDDGFVAKLGVGLAYGTQRWKITFPDPGASAECSSMSLGWDGSVYIGFWSNLYAFDAEGNLSWQVAAEGRLAEYAGGLLNGLGTAPAVATNGTIYITTERAGTAGALQAINSAGSVQWTFNVADRCFYSSPAIGSNGVIYFGTVGGKFHAVRSDGVGLWTNTLGGAIYSSPAIATNGDIFVANTLNVLYSIAPDGLTNRTWGLANPTYSSPAIGSNGWVYIGGSSNLYAFDPASSVTQWVCILNGGQIFATPTIGTNGMIYVGAGSNLYVLTSNGTTNRIWAVNGTVKSTATLDTNGNVLVGADVTADLHYLLSLNPVSGATNWAWEVDENIAYRSPLIRRDGTIYLSDWFNFYSIFGPAATVRSNWPTARHDVLRTGNAAFDAAALLKPTGLSVSQGAYQDRVLVNWTGNPNADYYEIYRSSTNDLTTAQPLSGPVVTTNYIDYFNPDMKGIIYYYWVRVTTPVATSDFSDQDAGGVPPNPPTWVEGSKGNPTNAIVITWNSSSNATAYYLYHSLNNATNTAVLLWTTNTAATNMIYTNSAPIRGLTYYYWVKAGNAQAGISDFSAGGGYINSGGTPPLPPVTVTATSNSYVAVTVAWSSSTGASMYAVYRNTNAVIPDSILTNLSGLVFSNTATVAFQNYYYWIRGTNQYGLGEFSDSAAGFRWLAPPLTVHATDGEFTNKVRVSWQIESTEPSSYRIWRSTTLDPDTSSNQATVPYLDSTSTNYDDLNITRGQGYYYWLQSRNDHGTSVLSVAYDLGGTAPLAPENVSATDGTFADRINVAWNSAGFAVVYEIYQTNSYVPGALTVPYAVSSGTAYSDTGAKPGERYYYWLKASNQFGRSELSAFDTGWRPLAPPAAIAASDGVSTAHLYVVWSAAENASSYELWRGTNSSSAAALMVNNSVATNAYDDAEATQGVLYYYWVKAKNSQFSSEFSSYDSGFRALGQVDLGISDFVFLPTFMAPGGSPAAVSFRIANYGQFDMTEPNSAWLACNFYVSSNAVFGDGDDDWLGDYTMSLPLPVNSNVVVVLSKTVRQSLALPAVLPGAYYVYVNIQHTLPSTWLDPNTANNTAERNGGVVLVGTNQQAVGFMMAINDYNGDGLTDLAMYQETAGAWAVWLSRNYDQVAASGFGGANFRAVPADYDGDGKTDLAVYRESSGTWEVWLSASDYGMTTASGLGGAGFDPVPADYDGDGRVDPAVYQESTGTWMGWLSGAGYAAVTAPGLGGTGFDPVPADYDGDGRADPAVYQESTGFWMAWLSSNGYSMAAGAGLGGAGYRPVAADYDRDGLADPAVFQASSGAWRVWLSASLYAEVRAQGMGAAGMVAAPGDYDGDGLTDPAVYWASFSMWRMWLSTQGYQEMSVLAWPGDGYQPVWP
ncbi:MAG: SBBP repeat-containing protein [Lentisphaerae bacterium]|nr:SBBP repeat-containing protein [Lentisphaerota bacterium]